MRIYIVFAALVGLALAQTACNQDKGITTPHGHRFINHTNGTTSKAVSGELLTINVYTWANDSLISSTVRDMGGAREVVLPDSATLASSPRVPAVFDALFMMTKGDSATLYQTVDSTMATGIKKQFGFDAKELRYEIVVVDQAGKDVVEQRQAEEQQKQAAMAAQQMEYEKLAPQVKARFPAVQADVSAMVKDYMANKLGSRLTTMPSGLKVVILDKGSGEPLKQGEPVNAHYFGSLTNGTMFDNSFERGMPLPFEVGGLIPGFNEGVMQLNHGGKGYFFIPYQLGYGEQGNPPVIPPKSELVFYVEVL